MKVKVNAMKNSLRPLIAGLVAATIAGSVIGQEIVLENAPKLVVVEDHGGASALPYYQHLNPQGSSQSTKASPATAAPQGPSITSAAAAEASMLPIRSDLLTPGKEPSRVIRAPGLSPVFLIGEDQLSVTWLKQRAADLQAMQAVGLVVNVTDAKNLAALRALAPRITFAPVSGDDIAQRLDLHHYPVLITATGIEQ
jgi:integrating conjugative element protein (TIGR03765 family)